MDVISEFQHPIEKMNENLVNAYSPVLQAITQMQAQYESILLPLQSVVEQWNESMVAALNNDSFQQQLNLVKDSLSSFASAFQGITIHENYVSIPEILIPDGFLYEEVSVAPSETNKLEPIKNSFCTKKLSFSDTLSVINALISLLLWLLTPFWNQIASHVVSDNDNSTDVVAPITEDQAQQILEYLSELTNCQQAILTLLEDSDKSVQENNSYSGDTQPHSAILDSGCPEDDGMPSISADELGNSE